MMKRGGSAKMKETQNVEFKQSWHDEYLKWICGFANAQKSPSDIRGETINVPINVLINVPIKERVLELIRTTAGINRARMSEVLSVDVKTIGRALKELDGVVEHRGSKKTGGYFVMGDKKIVERKP